MALSRQCDMKNGDNNNCLSWWHYPRAKEVKTRMLQNLNSQPMWTQDLFKRCTKAHHSVTGFEEPLIAGSADIYFIPTHLMEKAVTLVNLYAEVRRAKQSIL